TTVVSSTSMKVANITATATIQGLTVLCSAITLPCVNRAGHRQTGPELMLRIGIRLEHELHRYPLHHLYVVAGRVLGGKQTESRAGSGRNAVHVRLKLPAAERINRDLRLLPHPHVAQLRLFVISGHPKVVQLHDREEWLTRLHDLPDFDRLLADDTVRGGNHRGVTQI